MKKLTQVILPKVHKLLIIWVSIFMAWVPEHALALQRCQGAALASVEYLMMMDATATVSVEPPEECFSRHCIIYVTTKLSYTYYIPQPGNKLEPVDSETSNELRFMGSGEEIRDMEKTARWRMPTPLFKLDRAWVETVECHIS